MESAIIIRNLSKTFENQVKGRTLEVLAGLDLEIKGGSFVVLHGPNGCGKSTLLHILADVETFISGEVSIFGRNPSELRPGVLFQNYALTLFPWLNVSDNIAFAFNDCYKSQVVKEQAVEDYLAHVGLLSDIKSILKSYPYELSGGQQQLVALARALFGQPKLVLLDEPFSALDANHKRSVSLMIRDRCKQIGATCVSAIHDLDEAILVADNILVLSQVPLRIKGSVNVTFSNGRNASILTTSDFFDYKRRLLEIIDKEI